MIQFNLLPDVKKDYVKAKRTKRIVTSVSILAMATSIVVVFVLYAFLQIAQEKHIRDLTTDIEAATNEIIATDDIDKKLTIQNQLSLLGALHENKPETSRVLDYVKFVSPETLKVRSLDVRMENETISIAGSADTIATVNKFVDNIKVVRYSVLGEGSDDQLPTYFDLKTTLRGDDEGATYDIDFSFDPTIFDNTKIIKMNINDQVITTEDEVENAN